jgi:hypothetical protein
MVTEPFWQFWQSMTEPVRVCAADELHVVLTDEARKAATWRRYRGLDEFKSRLRRGEPGVIIRRFPNER